MRDQACVRFLQWCLPRLELRWPGFRKVRSTVRKRLRRRLRELGLADFDAYREYLETHAEEWARLDGFCRIPISRFYRDAGVFQALEDTILPAIAGRAIERGDDRLRLWCAGAASGEEPYTLALLWRLQLAPRFPTLDLEIVATEVDDHLLARADRGVYGAGSLARLPEAWHRAGFQRFGDDFRLKDAFRAGVRFEKMDIRQEMPAGPFDLIACRNLVFTYFAEPLQQRLLGKLTRRLQPSGILVIGSHERLPVVDAPLIPAAGSHPIFRKTTGKELA
ncbi:MAG: CheR family methyltransferase [Alphaproteobacteria bacterium]|jgi:chemotaxis protein methyltransferase CheR|nr:CheR family methyltransferase [Alphaproteobacteria bacterium]